MLEKPNNELENVEKQATEREREQSALIQRQYEEVHSHAKFMSVSYTLITGVLWIFTFVPLFLSIFGFFDEFICCCLLSVLLFVTEFWHCGIRTWLVRSSINKNTKAINFLGKEWLKRLGSSIKKEYGDAELIFNDKTAWLIAQVVVSQLKPELQIEKEALIANVLKGILEGITFALVAIGICLWVLFDKPFYIMLIFCVPAVVTVFFDGKLNVKVLTKVLNAIEEISKEN